MDLGWPGAGVNVQEHAPPLLAKLVDDAGLFPPEELPMPEAVARHRRDDAARHPVLTGRFLCPATRLEELLAELAPAEQLPLGLITSLDRAVLSATLERIADDTRVVLTGIEAPFGDLAAVPAGVRAFVEVPAVDHRAVASVAGTGHAVKVRCGGLRAELFPSAEQLGAFVHACARSSVPFKATAGLHHALPYRDHRTGFTHHGFLNLLLAVCRAVEGARREDVIAVLRITDADELVAEARQVTADHAAAARSLFVAYGSCSTSEPIEDLRALGLLHSVEVTA